MTGGGRELFVVRHGKSDWDAEYGNDADRPLARRGRRDCRRMAAWCAEQGLMPDVILSSPAERAADTARCLARGVGLDDDEVTLVPELYLADVGTLLAALAAVSPEARQVLLVGHNPGLDQLVVHLHGKAPPPSRSGKLMTTAAVARFRMPENWSKLRRGCAELLELARPKELPPL